MAAASSALLSPVSLSSISNPKPLHLVAAHNSLALLFRAFIGLSILTIGVIYIGVTDFLQKREREKFEKEEAAKKKKSGKKGEVGARTRAGPRGFGQKIEDDDDVDEAD